MQQLIRIFMCAFAALLSAHAGIISSTTCSGSVSGVSYFSEGPHHCVLNYPGSSPSAEAWVGPDSPKVTMPASPGDYLMMVISESVKAVAIPIGPAEVIGTFSAVALGQISLTLSTGGPIRPGVIEYYGYASDFYHSLYGSDVSVKLEFSNASEPHANCPLCPGAFATPSPATAAFTLGEAFTVNFEQMLGATGFFNAFANRFGGEARGTLVFAFRLFEDDGKTPVEIQAVPEPATWLLSSGALAALLAFKRMRRQNIL